MCIENDREDDLVVPAKTQLSLSTVRTHPNEVASERLDLQIALPFLQHVQ